MLPLVLIAALLAQQDPIRLARSTRFNTKGPSRINGLVLVDHERQPTFPHQAADTVLTGQVTGTQSYLSEDGKCLYTEYTVLVDKVFKTRHGVPGESIVLLREGGTLRRSDGSTLRQEIRNDYFAKLNQKLLLFLADEPTIKAFSYNKFWVIEDNLLKPFFHEDRDSPYAGKPIETAIAIITNP